MRLPLTIALACLAALPAHAADDARTELAACRSIAGDAERLACFDRAAERLLAQPRAPAAAQAQAAPAAPTAAPAAAPVAAAGASAEDNFGRERQMAAEEARRENQEARAMGELSATVTGIETRMDGLMTITLDNGHVWRQTRPDSKFRLKSGDRIRIQPGSLNSFILSGPTKRSTRVTRVK
jgi:hypothetical protein